MSPRDPGSPSSDSPLRSRRAWLTAAASIGLIGAARADNFAGVRYDPQTDELVVNMVYRGTNPDHQFTVQWGECQTPGGGRKQITALVLDDQWKDVAQTGYHKTFRVSLAGQTCRPADVTLKTAPRFYTTLKIPRAPQ